MSDAKTPQANPAKDAETKALTAGGATFEKWNEAKADWNSSGRVAFPEDPEAADKLGNELDTLAKHHNLKAAGELGCSPRRSASGRSAPSREAPPRQARPLRGEPHRLLEAAEAHEVLGAGLLPPADPEEGRGPESRADQVPGGGRGEVIAGECSWDPRHADGLQFIPVIVPSKDE